MQLSQLEKAVLTSVTWPFTLSTASRDSIAGRMLAASRSMNLALTSPPSLTLLAIAMSMDGILAPVVPRAHEVKKMRAKTTSRRPPSAKKVAPQTAGLDYNLRGSKYMFVFE